MSIITHKVNSIVVGQRPEDGYINLTKMVKAAGKQMNNYLRTDETKAFLEALSAETLQSVSDLVQVIKGGNSKLEQGTWAHPQVAIHCAQWCSPEFAVLVTKWVFEWMSQGKTPQSDIEITPTQPIAALPADMSDLIQETNRLYGEFETIYIEPTPALEIAREIGDRLLKLKEQVGHGNWEAFREANIRSPHTGQPMPSSTATLYQRVAKHWDALQQGNVQSVRDAMTLLRRDRGGLAQITTHPSSQFRSIQHRIELIRDGIELGDRLGGFDEHQQGYLRSQILEVLMEV